MRTALGERVTEASLDGAELNHYVICGNYRLRSVLSELIREGMDHNVGIFVLDLVRDLVDEIEVVIRPTAELLAKSGAVVTVARVAHRAVVLRDRYVLRTGVSIEKSAHVLEDSVVGLLTRKAGLFVLVGVCKLCKTVKRVTVAACKVRASAEILSYLASAVTAVELELDRERMIVEVCPARVSYVEYGYLLVLLDLDKGKCIIFGDLLELCCVEAATEVFFKIAVNAVERASQLAACDKELLLAGLDDKSVRAKLGAVEFALDLTVGLADYKLLFNRSGIVGHHLERRARELLYIRLKLICRSLLGLRGISSVDDNVIRPSAERNVALIVKIRRLCFLRLIGGFLCRLVGRLIRGSVGRRVGRVGNASAARGKRGEKKRGE